MFNLRRLANKDDRSCVKDVMHCIKSGITVYTINERWLENLSLILVEVACRHL